MLPCRPVDLPAQEIPSWFVLTAAFLFGAAWGSFFNVAIYRWPRGMSVVTPPSTCPACGTLIPARHNVPILGYLFLGGKTACCKTRLSPRYALVELLTAMLAVAIAQRFYVGAPESATVLGAAIHAGLLFIFVGGLVIVTFVDLERMEIPDEVSLPCAALGLATAPLRDPAHIGDYALGAGGGFLAIQLLFVWSYEHLTGRRGMGEGDSKLLMMIGAFLGWQGALFAVVAGSVQGIAVSIFALVTGTPLGPDLEALEAEERQLAGIGSEPAEQEQREDPQEHELYEEPEPSYFGHLKLPFGPLLALGAIEYLFFGQRIIELWFGWIGSWFG